MGTNPAQANTAFKLDFAQWQPGYWRLSWPARESATYAVQASAGLAQTWSTLTSRTDALPTAEYVAHATNSQGFFRVQRE